METKPLTTTPPARPAVIPVDFSARRRPTLKHLGNGVYAYPRPCEQCGVTVEPNETKCSQCATKAAKVVFYERPYVDGRQTLRTLKSTSLRHAQIERGKLRSDQALSKIGCGKDPYARSSVANVAHLAKGYLDAGCPKRDGSGRAGKQLSDEKRSVQALCRHMGKKPWSTITFEDLGAYHAKRVEEIERGDGHRTVDVEERTLSSIFRWALRHQRATGVDRNPIGHDRPLHCRPETVRHCRDVMPANAEELHALARYLFEVRQSEPLGWQLLLEAMIGQRSNEMLRMRMDASAPFEAGFIQGKHLYLHRSQSSKGTFPYIEIHAALRDCLAAHRAWHKLRYPKGSPWYFPSFYGAGENPVSAEALTRAMTRAAVALKLPHRTSHGLRSYYVNVLRSNGRLDAEIALRIGHKTGGKLIVQVYGEILPYKVTWLPDKTAPAWSKWLPGSSPIGEQLEFGL